MPWKEVKKGLFEIPANRREMAFVYKDPDGLRWIFEVRSRNNPMADGTVTRLKAWSKKKAIEMGSRALVEYCKDK